MSTFVRNIIRSFVHLLEKLNSTSLHRLLIYAMLIYPITILYFYHTEIGLMISLPSKNVEIHDITSAQDRCYTLKNKYGAESVLLYVYQPIGINKTHKELAAFSASHEISPFQSIKSVRLMSRTKIAEDLRQHDFSLITQTSGHHESSILSTYELNSAYVIAIHDATSGQIIGEAVWVFKRQKSIDVKKLIRDSQIFIYDII